jgi:hypothetical protein
MNKPLLGLLLGSVLGALDGLSALLSAPETAPAILSIVIGSTLKGLVVGLITGFFARKYNSLPLGILFGLGAGLFFAYVIVAMEGKYFWQIMLPGGLMGAIVGYATQRYGRAPSTA